MALVFIIGFGQKQGALSPLIEGCANGADVIQTSVYELAEQHLQRGGELTEAYPPVGQSLYVSSLRELLPEEQHTLVGWSMGGLVSLEFAANFPELVERIVLLGSTASFINRSDDSGAYNSGVSPYSLRAMRLGIKSARKLTMEMFFKTVYQKGFNSKQLKEKTSQVMQLDIDILLHGLSYLENCDVRAPLKDIQQRVLVLHGDEDKIIPFSSGEYVANHLPNAVLESIRGGGHAFCEENPKPVAKEIKEFLRYE